jgi:hypothetical protein
MRNCEREGQSFPEDQFKDMVSDADAQTYKVHYVKQPMHTSTGLDWPIVSSSPIQDEDVDDVQ